ncbi:MAG: aspartyl-phosphate phosphatase Spo0E family protein [Bacillota bacterium]|nr:aspartyl-phosphate phosphatase Spo0E family protein [Bacillota bacterium]
MLKNSSDVLESKIERLRKELMVIANNEGLCCEETILISQRLDNYIAKYQAIKKEKIKLFC